MVEVKREHPTSVSDVQTSGDNNENIIGNSDDTPNNQRNNFKKEQDNYSSGQPYNWKGNNEDVGVIMTLRSERYKNKVLFSTFTDKLKKYVTQNFDHANDMVTILDKHKDPVTAINALQPEDLTEEEQKSEVSKMIQKEKVRNHMDRLTKLDNNKMKLYGVIWGQCTTALQEVIKSSTDYEEKDLEFDCIWLLQKVKMTSAEMDERNNIHYTLTTAIKQAFNVRQRENETNEGFRKRFESQILTLHLVGGEHILVSPEILKKSIQGTASEKDMQDEEQKMKGMMLLLGSDPNRFGKLQKSLEEGVLLGRDEYPKTIIGAYELLQSTVPNLTKSGRFNKFRRGTRARLGNLSFAQVTDSNTISSTDGRLYPNVICHLCKQPGHYKNQCPNKTKQVILTQFVLNQQERGTICSSWVLLDTCSTVSVFCSKDLVTDIQACTQDNALTVISNGGTEYFDKTATAKILPINVHFNSESLANILSLSDVANLPGARLTMDTNIDRAILLHYNGDTIQFKECRNGLYYYDTNVIHSKPVLSPYSLLNTVADNKLHYSQKEIKGADVARKIQASMGWPSSQSFKHMINNNLIRNCGITSDDVSRAERIYDLPPPILKGKSTRSKPPKVNIHHTPLPLQIKERHVDVKLHVDFFYINGLPILHTKSENINFLTVQTGKTRTTSSIVYGLKKVINLYQKRGFHVKSIFADNEFDIESMRNELLPIVMHIFAADEHCPIAERSIRTVKDRTRSVCHSLPYKRYTRLMVYALVELVIYWLNSFPSKGSVSETLSPANLVTGRAAPDFNKGYIQFGAYAWVHVKTTNTMKARRTPCIALGPSNEWGGHFFMSLYSGKKLHVYDWVEAPIDRDVISRVEELAEDEGQPLIIDNMPTFEWSLGNEIIGDDSGLVEEEKYEVIEEGTDTDTPDIQDNDNAPDRNDDNESTIGISNNVPIIIDDYDDHENSQSPTDQVANDNEPVGALEHPQVNKSLHVGIQERDGDTDNYAENRELNGNSDDIEENAITPIVDNLNTTDTVPHMNDIARSYQETEERLDHELQEISDLIEGMGSDSLPTVDEEGEWYIDNKGNKSRKRRTTRKNAGTGVDRMLINNERKRLCQIQTQLFHANQENAKE